MRAASVSQRALAQVARGLDLGSYVLLGKGELATGGRQKDSILCDTFEAVIGAVYLCHGARGGPRGGRTSRRPDPGGRGDLGAGLDWKTRPGARGGARARCPQLRRRGQRTGSRAVLHRQAVLAGEPLGDRRGPGQEGGRAAGGLARVRGPAGDAGAAPTVPELPEVETVRGGLERHVLDRDASPRRRGAARLGWSAARSAAPTSLRAGCVGRSFAAAVRRGKFLWLPLAEAGNRRRRCSCTSA